MSDLLKTMRASGLVGWVGCAMMLGGCQSVEPVPARVVDSLESIQAALMDAQHGHAPEPEAPTSIVPDIVAQALVPDLAVFSQARAHRFDLSVQDMPAAMFFMSLVQGTGYNMVLQEGVEGSISLELKQVTMDEVMGLIRDAYGFDFQRNGNVYSVLPRGVRTEMFHVDYLAVQRIGKSSTTISAGSGTSTGGGESAANTGGTGAGAFPTNRGSASIETGTDNDFWLELKDTLETFLGISGGEGGDGSEGRKVVIAPQTGLVVVRAMPRELRAVREFLDRSQFIVKRQVILEAKILEVSLDDSFQAGINWAAIGELSAGKTAYFAQGGRSPNNGGVDRLDRPYAGVPGIASPVGQGGVFSAALELKDFSAVVDLLSTQGTVQVLSSPRVSTVNNQKAVIKVGTDEFFVTNASVTTTTGDNPLTTPSIELTPFFSGIALDVTPQISDDGEIVLHVHPQISEVREQDKSVTVGGQSFDLPLAISSIRESDSIVKANSGQVVMIGGLMETKSFDTNSSVPGLGDIPLLGHLFRQKSQESRKSELVILLRPTLTGGDTWNTSLTDSLHRFEDLGSVLRP